MLGVGILVEAADPRPRRGVHLVWAGERIRPEYPLPAPAVDQRLEPARDRFVVPVEQLVVMKLQSNRGQDRVHLRDLIEVGLLERDRYLDLPDEFRRRLDALLRESGRE